MTDVATNPLSYNAYITAIATLAVVNVQNVGGVMVGNNDPAFDAIIPTMLDYAEGRISRDLDLLPSLTSTGYTLTQANNQFAIPVNDFVTIQTIGVTVGTATVPLLPVSKEWLQSMYNDTSYLSVPGFFAMVGGDRATGGITDNNIIVGPYPDDAYPIAVTGTVRLPSLYKFANPTDADTGVTFISQWTPEMLVMASMIYITGYQRNFSANSNDPQMGPNYENQYQVLLGRAIIEESRKKFQASAWSSMAPPAAASPGR